MFRRSTLIALSVLFCATILMALFVLRTGPNDDAAYDALLASTRPMSDSEPGQQHRTGVVKEVWTTEGDHRLLLRIICDSSILEFTASEVIEHMQGVSAIQQEKLYLDGDQPMQELRYIEANEASYHYRSGLFVAKEATLTKLRAEGHAPIASIEGLDPMITGMARSAEFQLKGDGLDFTASQLRATVYTDRGLL